MQTHVAPKQEYMAAFKRYEPVIMDSTAVMTYKACPLKYFYRIVLGFAAKDTAPYFYFGSAYHKFREILEREMVRGAKEGEAFQCALATAEEYYKKHGKGGPQPGSQFDFLTLERLKKSCLEAFKFWLQERVNGKIKVIAFEQPFTLQMDDGTICAGRADQIVEWRGEVWGRDFKTSSKTGPFYTRTLEPNDQFTRYTWAESKLHGVQVKGQIVEVLYNSKREGPKIETFTTTRSTGQLKRWEAEHSFWMDMINKSRAEDMYPMNEKSCQYCEYHSVCKAPSESGKMSMLKTYFHVNPWDCTNVPD
jgi:hypothetical protein